MSPLASSFLAWGMNQTGCVGKRFLKVFLLLVALLLLWQGVMVLRVAWLREHDPKTTAFMEQRRDELREAGEPDDLEYQFVSYEQISSHLRSAVLVSEDSRFYEHSGVDTEELEKVLQKAWEKRELGRGGSTITQQLAKNLYLSPSRSPIRKARELLIAMYMEWILSKKRILELYLNVVEMGERVYGAEAAARHYFGVSAANLSPSQAALLAGSLPNPRKMNPGNPGPYLQSRRDIILSRMRRWGYMVDKQVAESETEEDRRESEDAEDPPEEDPAPREEEPEEPEMLPPYSEQIGTPLPEDVEEPPSSEEESDFPAESDSEPPEEEPQLMRSG